MATAKKQPSGRWFIQLDVAGQRLSGTFDTKAQANAWAAQRATELRTERIEGAGKVKTLRDLLRKYALEVSPTKKGARWETVRLAAFETRTHAGLPLSRRIADISSADLARWRDARLAAVSRGSVLREMTLLSSVFEHARRELGWVLSNPMRNLRRPAEPDHRERIITGPEIRAVLRQLGWRMGPVRTVSQAAGMAFVLALQTGMRAGEICALTWRDIKADHLVVQDGKTGSRPVPLTDAALRVIGCLRDFDSQSVFSIKAQTLDALFRRARMRAGLYGFTFHDSRHTAATRLAQRLHVLDLCKVFGWKQTSRALTYYNPSAADLRLRMSGGSKK